MEENSNKSYLDLFLYPFQMSCIYDLCVVSRCTLYLNKILFTLEDKTVFALKKYSI